MSKNPSEIVWNSMANLIAVCVFENGNNNAMDAEFKTPFGLKVKCHFEFDVVPEGENE